MPTQDRADRTGASGPIRLLENAELLLRGERPAVGAVGHLGSDRHGGWHDGWPLRAFLIGVLRKTSVRMQIERTR